MIVPPPSTFHFDRERRADAAEHRAEQAMTLEESLTGLTGAGVYRMVPWQGEPHISWSHHLGRRVARLARTFGERLSRIDTWRAASRLDVLLILYAVTKADFPGEYARRLRLPNAWFLRLSDSDPFPQLLTSNRIPPNDDPVVGPFANRDAAQYCVEETEGLFQLRRCTGWLEPAPDHPGCIYGEMGQCLRPCQMAVTETEYASEVERAREFVVTGGRAAITRLSLARERASSELDFELAAQLHRRLEKVKEAAAARDGVVGDARRFSGLAVTPGAMAGSCQLRLMQAGCWREPVVLAFGDDAPTTQSLDRTLRQMLEQALAGASEAGNEAGRMAEHLALFSRWYRSSWRDGEWFPFRKLADLNYRKLVRHVSKLATQQPA